MGATAAKRSTDMAARVDLIKEMLIKSPNKGVSRKELAATFGVSHTTIDKDINRILSDLTDGSLVKDKRGFIMYVPKTRYSDNKNDEGYSDPTASVAIKNTEPVKKLNLTAIPKPGDVWDVKSSASTCGSEKYVVVAVDEETEIATCISYEIVPEHQVKVSHKLYSKPLKYFISRSWGLPLSELTKIRNEIAAYLDIVPEKEIVEKVVIKKVEVPAKETEPKVVKMPEKNDPYEKKWSDIEVDLMLASQKASIYEKVFNRVTEVGSYD